jgi:four helix bundle protein
MTPKAKTYRELLVWQKAMDLVIETYALTAKFPKSEQFGLSTQLQRAAVSIPSNIAEGHARKSRLEFSHHLSYSRGSLAEVETQMILANRLGYVNREAIKTFWSLSQEVGKMLTPMIATLSKGIRQSPGSKNTQPLNSDL